MNRTNTMLILILTFMISFASSTAAIAKEKPAGLLTLNGANLSITPITSETKGVTLIPLRDMATALGAQVFWDAATKTAKVTNGTTTLEIKTKGSIVKVNGISLELSTAPTIVQRRLYVPLRWLIETLGAHVDWNFITGDITIITPT